jgi:hypothetical protein
MKPENNIYEQFKKAATNAEQKEFPATDSVWNRVETKLDQKILVKQNTLWKKIAIAASLLLVATLGFHFFNKQTTMIVPANEVVVNDTLNTITDSVTNEALVVEEKQINPALKGNADIILKEQIKKETQVAVQDTVVQKLPNIALTISETKRNVQADESKKPIATSITAYGNAKNTQSARGVRQNIGFFEDNIEVKSAKQVAKKEAPLLVIDDKDNDIQTVGTLEPDEIESILVLTDPLYIINGVEYTERELFGPNPTSPYAPLNKQNIESLSILQDEKAVYMYGEIGKKGVVIITTKGGKPAAKTK